MTLLRTRDRNNTITVIYAAQHYRLLFVPIDRNDLDCNLKQTVPQTPIILMRLARGTKMHNYTP